MNSIKNSIRTFFDKIEYSKGYEIMREISTSKIKNKTEIKKKWNEKEL